MYLFFNTTTGVMFKEFGHGHQQITYEVSSRDSVLDKNL